MAKIKFIILFSISLFIWGCSSSMEGGDPDGSTGDSGATADGGESVAFGDPWVRIGALGEGDTRHTLEVKVQNENRLFYCNVRSLNAVDISDPYKPSSSFSLSSNYPNSRGFSGSKRWQHMTWNGDLIYYSHRGDETQVLSYIAGFDVSQSGRPEVVNFDNQAEGWSIEAIAASGSLVYAAVHQHGVAVLENDGSSTLKLRGVVSGLENSWGVAANGDMIYVADGPGGFAVVDASNPASPQIIGTLETGGAPQHVEYDPETKVAYVAAGSAGLLAIDVSDGTNPTLLSSHDTQGSAVQVTISGSYAYVADWNDARVFDISDPSNIKFLSSESVAPQSGGNRPQSFTRVLGIGALNEIAFVGEWKEIYVYEVRPENSAPDVFVPTQTLDFGTISSATSRVIQVVNEGNRDLTISSIESSNSGFSYSVENLIVEAGDKRSFEVTFTPPSTSPMASEILLHSDDPDEPILAVEAIANQPGLGVGDQAPAVEMTNLSGGTWTLNDAQGKPVLLAYFATF